ncbi:MAG: hypothetical protein ACYDAG_11585 [Chloroflexota bacterium]
MDQPADVPRLFGPRTWLMVGVAAILMIGLGLTSHLTHTATIPNGGLPVSNSQTVANINAYDPQVSLTRRYLTDLAGLNYAAAYRLLSPARRARNTEAQFAREQHARGLFGLPTVWADDLASTRAEFVIGRPDGSSTTARHRYLLSQENGKWRVDREVPIPPSPAAFPNLPAAMRGFVRHDAGDIWVPTVELLRQQPFRGTQLLMFSYVEPSVPGRLTPERVAVLADYADGKDGWTFAGGGKTGLTAGMNVADVAMGVTAFGENQRYVAYYGVVENSNAVTLSFQEANGARHTRNIHGHKTVLFLNDRNPYQPLPFAHPFQSIRATDIYGNTLRTNPA